MGVSPEEYQYGKTALLHLMRQLDESYASLPADDRVVRQPLFEAWLSDLQKRGWKRVDVYDVVLEILQNHYTEFAEWTVDRLMDVETGLSGFCQSDSIIRFPGETAEERIAGFERGNQRP